ncbi:hypothetical protein [Nocardioides jensenii]|uniref:hypothetical protein n=1 Tax=Nocardioides jensenii TaxID=1843 RepID=UPI000837782A|nr:hypothetical protein [Nocardioides jensenii]
MRSPFAHLIASALLVIAMVGCSGEPEQDATTPSTPGATSTDPASAGTQPSGWESTGVRRISVEVGHCYVASIRFDGERWNVPFRKQFGWGGGDSGHDHRAWVGSGAIVRTAPGTARYTDDGGEVLDLLPADHPSVRKVEHAGCR